MSDIEYEYSGSVGDGDIDSDGESENYKNTNFIKNKKINNTKTSIRDYDADDGEDQDDDETNQDDEELENDDEVEIEIENKNDENQDDDEDTEIEYDAEEETDNDDYEVDDDDDDDNEDNSNTKTKSSAKSGGAKGDKNKVVKSEKIQNNIQLDVGNNDEYEDDDDDYQDENYLQKFDKEMTKNYIMNFHPECLNHNYDEIKALTKVTRDEFNMIVDPLHKTVPFLTKYERARILGQRSKQIECGAKPLVKVPENIIDGYVIAELELEQKTIPFIIRRPIPSGGSEYWNLKDLEVISF